LGTEEEPFEGEVPLSDVEKSIVNHIKQEVNSGNRVKFVFDGFSHKTSAEFIDFTKQFGTPNFIIHLKTKDATIKDRYCKDKELDAVPEVEEGGENEFKTNEDAADKLKDGMTEAVSDVADRISTYNINTDDSLEKTNKELANNFLPKVLLVNHEKRLGIDTTCANLAIKYNMIYISAYQIIKQNIEGNTDWGKKLLAGKRTKEISLTT
jgi:adenylate kinase family enzyme